MLLSRKKILAGVLCAAMVLSTSQSVAWSETAEVAAEAGSADTADTAESAEAEAPEEEEPEEAPITEEQAFAECKLFAESNTHALYANESTGIFVIQTKSNGYLWWSSPYDVDSDPVANGSKKDDLKSAMIINAVKVTDTESPSTDVNSYESCVETGNFKLDPVENGFKITYEFKEEGITIPYYVVLNGDHVDVSIAVDELVEKEHIPADPNSTEIINTESIRSVVDVSLLHAFGAGSTSEEGYIITPDGSGAVINFNNGRTNSTEYSQKIYGKDIAISQDMAPAKTEKAHLPILGIVKGDNAVLAVVKEGSAYATVRASVSGQRATSYNTAWFDFSLRSTDSYYMGQSNTALEAYEIDHIPEPRLTVSYYPIEKKDISYVDVALRYQQYMVEEMGMTKKTQDGSSPFYLDIFGGTVKQQSVMGFPISLETPATTYEEAKEIVESFYNLGINDMVITYEDFNGAGITDRISGGVDYSGTLGGKGKFKQLADYCASIGATLAPSVELMEYERSGNGFSKTGASSIRVTKAYATQGAYERAFGTPHDTRANWYILSPANYNKAYDSVISSYTKEGMSAISVADGTNMLYSDFTGNATRKTSRQQAVEILKENYAKINASGMKFVANACNDYAIPYADCIRNVPLYSSNFDVYDYDIPFIQIVLHGYVPYTTKAKNASSGAEELFILSVATGTPLHYEVMHENPNEFTDCSYDTLFYTFYEGWLDVAAGEYKLAKDHIAKLSDETITDFKYIDRDIVETTFSDGTVIKADLYNFTLEINGTEISLADYGLKGATTD